MTKEKGNRKKKDPAVFFPLACWKWAKSCQEEERRPFPRAEGMTWEPYVCGVERERDRAEGRGGDPVWAEFSLLHSCNWARPFSFHPLEEKKQHFIRPQPQSNISKITAMWPSTSKNYIRPKIKSLCSQFPPTCFLYSLFPFAEDFPVTENLRYDAETLPLWWITSLYILGHHDILCVWKHVVSIVSL